VTSPRVSVALDRIADEAGIGHVTAHQLRHTLATQANMRGVASDASRGRVRNRALVLI
jgi:integrase/recombinase XerD